MFYLVYSSNMTSQDMDERSRRIVLTAIQLAEEGGFEAVRLRDVAAHAEVALGTVYKRFRSKEEMLLAAMELMVGQLERSVKKDPPLGTTPLERVNGLFAVLTDHMMQRPHLTRAVLRATTSGDASVRDKVLRFHSRMVELVAGSLRGAENEKAFFNPSQLRDLSNLLQQVWFAALVGWMGGLHDVQEVLRQVRWAALWMLRGLEDRGVV